MKHFQLYAIACFLFTVLALLPEVSSAQASTPGNIVVIVTHKRAYPADGRRTEIDSLMTEWWQKVGKKVTTWVSVKTLTHYYSDDSRDFVEIIEYKTLADIEASDKLIDDLEEKAWPDKAQREAFFKKLRKYFTGEHSDKIFRALPAYGKN